MPTQLVSNDVLQQSKKILFIAHLALGDFTYLQNFFQAFSERFPHIEIHIWVDEVRRSRRAADWIHLKKYALYDWLADCSFVAKVYNQTYSPELFRQSIADAQQQQYPLVVSLSTLRPPMYAALARKISPAGFVVGMKREPGFFALHQRLAYRKLNATVNPDAMARSGQHITAVYALWFETLFGLTLEESLRFPFVHIPEQWRDHVHQQLAEWGFAGDRQASDKLVFINPFAKNNKRCWPLSRVLDLMRVMRQIEVWRDTCFVVNVVPEEMANAKKFFGSHLVERVQLFSAEDNFFQLPALLRECDLIISVETAVMHLANAVHVPVIALMRQKNPEWAPIDKENSTIVTTLQRRDWVKAITVVQVAEVLKLNLCKLT